MRLLILLATQMLASQMLAWPVIAQTTVQTAAPTAGETTVVPAASANVAPVDPELRLRLATPRSCLENFRVAMEERNRSDALSCLDFSGFASPSETRTTNGSLLAYQLSQILGSVTIDAALLDYEEFEKTCRLSEFAYEESGSPLQDGRRTDFDMLAISKGADGLWRFDPGTVTHVEELYEKWSPSIASSLTADAPKPTAVWLAEQFPETLHAKRFLIADYKWILLAALVALGFLADAIVGAVAFQLSHVWFGEKRTEEKDAAVRQLWKPFGLLVQALVWYYGVSQIGIPSWTTGYLATGLRFFAVFAGAWVLLRLIDLASSYLATRAKRTASRFDDVLVPLMTTIVKGIVILMGLLVCAETFNLNVNTLLGGLGIGGMALALASKDAVSNLFGSMTVLMDRPFEIGDWVITEDIEGTVEMVGFRSTRIRTFYNSLITLPNSRLTTAVVDNMGRRRYRRVKTTLGVQYNTTPEQIDAFCEGIRELIRRSPATRKDYYHVYFSGFGECSLDIMIYFFLRVPDWSGELKERHRLFGEILRLAQELKVEFAFPTRTLHMHPESALPAPHALPHTDSELLGRESAARVLERTC